MRPFVRLGQWTLLKKKASVCDQLERNSVVATLSPCILYHDKGFRGAHCGYGERRGRTRKERRVKLVMLLLVRDEADIVAANMAFHLSQGVDFIVAIDNGSVDGTRDILDEYERAGHARVFDEPGRDYAQAKWVTRAMEHARDELSADWIFSNDADEFWVPRAGDLRQVVTGCRVQLLSAGRLNMVYPWDWPGAGPWYSRVIGRVAEPVPRPVLKDIYRDPLPCPYFYLALPPKVLMRAAGLTSVAQGNHAATYDGRVESIPGALDIFHYPVRSREQFERKVIQGGQAYAANTELPEMAGWHWRRWYRAYQEQGIEVVLADALPSKTTFDLDLQSGIAVEDPRFAEIMAASMP